MNVKERNRKTTEKKYKRIIRDIASGKFYVNQIGRPLSTPYNYLRSFLSCDSIKWKKKIFLYRRFISFVQPIHMYGRHSQSR